MAQARGLGPRVGGRLTLFCIHRVNRDFMDMLRRLINCIISIIIIIVVGGIRPPNPNAANPVVLFSPLIRLDLLPFYFILFFSRTFPPLFFYINLVSLVCLVPSGSENALLVIMITRKPS